jgi:hypothetical protein
MCSAMHGAFSAYRHALQRTAFNLTHKAVWSTRRFRLVGSSFNGHIDGTVTTILWNDFCQRQLIGRFNTGAPKQLQTEFFDRKFFEPSCLERVFGSKIVIKWRHAPFS